jgi:predicted transcriptional regulator
MKTTIEIPDELYRKAKSMAALRGRKFKDLIEEALRLIVEGPRRIRRE